MRFIFNLQGQFVLDVEHSFSRYVLMDNLLISTIYVLKIFILMQQ